MITRRRWDAGASPGEMIRSALCWAKNPERKARLYRVALVRQVWDELSWVSRVLTELAERQADGDFDESVLPRSLEYIAEGVLYCAEAWRGHRSDQFPHYWFDDYGRYLVQIGYPKPPNADWVETINSERFHKLAWLALGTHFEWDGPSDLSAGRGFDSVPLIRDIFGTPFRPASFRPSWRTGTVLSLARQMYELRDFSAMPILADALQDTGCDAADVLNHCRDTSAQHVRGCWVVDLVLGCE